MDRPRQDSDNSVISPAEPSGERTASNASQISLPPITEGFPQISADKKSPESPTLCRKRPKLLLPTQQHIPADAVVKFDGEVLKTYYIDGVPYTMQEARNETVARAERATVDKRRITYELVVIQQPVRARACGSGPRCMQSSPFGSKSPANSVTASADRRPIDPPPVVQLRVFEGEKGQEREFTMSYDATFVLYASLELGRPIAGARLYAQNTTPVLTGVPVAGTAYLDKPAPAAYFIFPDLSVRHEGWYNLRFCLFEGIKNAVDADPSHPHMPIDLGRTGEDNKVNPWEGMINRMEVRSSKFQVFSAKKFPGLKGSTDLSRLIADQGCRVRIRREVRQRKRPSKDDVSDDDDRRSEIRATPEGYHTPTPSDHGRSLSRNSHDGSVYFGADHYRRFSTDSAYGQNTLPPMRPPQSPADRPAAHQHYMPAPPHIASTFNMPPPSSMLTQRPPMPSYSSMPDPRAQPPGPIPAEKSLPPLSSVGSFDASRGLYNLPESSVGPQKRAYSPHSSYNPDAPIKDRARPDTLPAPQPQRADSIPHFSRGWSQGVMEADADEPESDSEDSLIEGAYTYKRADGSFGNKVNMHLSTYNHATRG